MDKPISLNSLRFSNERGEVVVKEEYLITFSDSDKLEKFIADRHKYWESLYDMRLLLSPDQNETLEDVEIKTVFKLAGQYMKIPYKDVLQRTRKPNIIEARRFAIMICIERGVKPQTIARAIGYDHATIGHHRDKFYDFCDTYSDYYDKFLGVQDYVLSTLNGRFREDGSGELIKSSS